MALHLHERNITDLEVDAIVNAANTELQHGGGVAAAIVGAGGRVIQEESDRIGWCDLGKAVATGAGALKARYVIHVPTVDYTTSGLCAHCARPGTRLVPEPTALPLVWRLARRSAESRRHAAAPVPYMQPAAEQS